MHCRKELLMRWAH